jgi:hypothetical protein
MIRKFCEAGIYKIIFDAGSQGCFHSYSERLTYTHDDDSFGSPVEESLGSNHKEVLPHNPDEIDGKVIADFAAIIPQLFQKDQLCTIDDLAFTEREYEQCKKDILKFKAASELNKKNQATGFNFNKNNLDFDRLVRLVDSVKHIDKQTLNRIWFDESDGWSTTTFWKRVQFVNNNNESLSIVSTHYNSDAFCFPWTVSLDGYSVNTTNFNINRFISKAYPLFLSGTDRLTVLHSLVKAIY